MESGFWQTLPRPIVGLSPMDGVTDAPFRYMTAKYGHPAVMFTEFTAAEGIRAGAERLLMDFLYSPLERPVVAQLFGSDPAAFTVAAGVAAALGFDGIDINMGCPSKNIAEKGAGAALIRDPERAKAIIRATRAGIEQWVNGASLEEMGVLPHIISAVEERRKVLSLSEERKPIPVSVKTRIGYDSVVIEEWVQHLLEEQPVVISIHGRTLKQLYSGHADWEAIGRAAAIIKQTSTLVLGNGDIASLSDALEKCAAFGLHGALIGRSCFGNPWIFQNYTPSFEERKAAALEHARLHVEMLGDRVFMRMRKHLLDYTRGFEGARELRVQLMRANTLAEVEQLLLD